MKKRTPQEIFIETIKEMMQTRALDTISVQEILDASGFSRPTFYRYYRDKRELVEDVFKKELSGPFFWDFSRSLEEREIEFLTHLRKNRPFYLNALKTSGQNSFYHMWLDQAVSSVARYYRSLPEYASVSNEDLTFCARYLSLAFVNMNIDWLRDENPLPPEVMADKLGRVMRGGVDGFLQA